MPKTETPPPVPARQDDGTTNPHPLPTQTLQIPTDAEEQTALFELHQREAALMAADPFLPDQLKATGPRSNRHVFKPEQVKAICYRIARQAERWGMDPWALAQEAYPVGGKLAYQGKVFGALANTLGGLRGPLSYSHEGQGENRKVTVEGVKRDGEVLSVELTKKQAIAHLDKSKLNAMWGNDVDQKLCYSGAIRWCRRHRPELVMGCHAVEEVPEQTGPVQVITEQVERLDAVAAEVMAGDTPEPTDGKLFDSAPTEQEAAQ